MKVTSCSDASNIIGNALLFHHEDCEGLDIPVIQHKNILNTSVCVSCISTF